MIGERVVEQANGIEPVESVVMFTVGRSGCLKFFDYGSVLNFILKI